MIQRPQYLAFLIFTAWCSLSFGQMVADPSGVQVPASFNSWADAVKQVTATLVLAIFCYVFWRDNRELRTKLLDVMENTINKTNETNQALMIEIKNLRADIHERNARG